MQLKIYCNFLCLFAFCLTDEFSVVFVKFYSVKKVATYDAVMADGCTTDCTIIAIRQASGRDGGEGSATGGSVTQV